MSGEVHDRHAHDRLLAEWGRSPLRRPSASWPRLFWTEAETESLRERARRLPGLIERARTAAEQVIADPAIFAKEPAWHHNQQGPILTLAQAAWLTGEERLVSLSSRLMDRAASAETWVAPVHRPMPCDHCAANTGATLAQALDFLAGRLTEDHVRRYREAVREKCLDPFLATCREGSAFWAKRDCVSNWRIMTCGDAGLAALGTTLDDEDLEVILAYATEGVVDMLGRIPDDGDYGEGPHYFLATLGMGLRYLVALCRLWPDAEAFLRHPRLARVADYLIHVTEPDGHVFDYFDNGLAWGARERAAMHLLAATSRRADLAHLARQGTIETIVQITWDDPDLPSSPHDGPTSAHFRNTGLVVSRSDWSDDAVYVGFRCGPNTFGHSHLDCGGFVISSGASRLAIDEGVWSYAHFLGFFDTGYRRWTFDANATVGHNTLLIDGCGQVYDENGPGRIVHYEADESGMVAVGDLSAPYGGLVTECVRTLVYVRPGTVIIFDRIRSDEPRTVEWLLHHRGEMAGEGRVWELVVGGAKLTVHRLLGRDDDPWRVSDVVRRTHYPDSNTGQPQSPCIRYRSAGPVQAKTEHDLLFVLTVGDIATQPAVTVDGQVIEVRAAGHRATITPGERRAEIAPLGG